MKEPCQKIGYSDITNGQGRCQKKERGDPEKGTSMDHKENQFENFQRRVPRILSDYSKANSYTFSQKTTNVVNWAVSRKK